MGQVEEAGAVDGIGVKCVVSITPSDREDRPSNPRIDERDRSRDPGQQTNFVSRSDGRKRIPGPDQTVTVGGSVSDRYPIHREQSISSGCPLMSMTLELRSPRGVTVSTNEIAFETKTRLTYDEAVTRCREALAAEGFGVLSEIDIRATLKKKLDVDHEPYLILGACHPPSAHRALTLQPAVGVLLPCNVTVSVEQGQTVVRAMNPESVMGLLNEPGVEQLAAEIGSALRRALASVG